MKSKTFLAAIALLLAPFISGRAGDRPNVLFIIADDLNNDIGCYGHPLVKTPNIDALATRGVLFDRAYCQYPLCNPTRASFLSGLRPDSTGVFDNGVHFRTAAPDIATLPEHFRNHGYTTAGIGKLFHDGVPRGGEPLTDPRSWDFATPAHGRENDDIDKIHSLVPGKVGGQVSWLADEGDPTELTDARRATAAIQWLKQNQNGNSQKPFFLAVGFYRPHTPYVAPTRFFDNHPLDQIKIPERPFADRDDIPLAALHDKREQLSMTDEQRHLATQGYYASTSFMDYQVGRLLSTLDELKLSTNTIVIFVSDHGYHLGEHGLWQKRSLFEESARIPLIITTPDRLSAGKKCNRFVELVDLYPTLAELCDLPQPAHLQGRSLAPLLKNVTAPFRPDALTQTVCATHSLAKPESPHGYSLRTERYRYTEWNGGIEGIELYDHKTDPKEQTNRAFDPDYINIAKKLQQRLHARIADGGRVIPETTAATPADRQFYIVTLGDSITKGVRSGVTDADTFARRLERSLIQSGLPTQVTNVGVGGERTDQALARLDKIIGLQPKPDLVTLMYGTNDSYIDTDKTTSRLSTSKYRANLIKIIERLRAAGITPILMTPPRFGDSHRLNGIGEHPNISLKKFVNHCRKVAGELDVPLVDHHAYWTLQQDSGINIRNWTTDQCHPNAEGHRQVTQRMLPTVSVTLKNIATRRTENKRPGK